MLNGVLRAFGLVRLARYEHLAQQLRRMEARAAKAIADLENLRKVEGKLAKQEAAIGEARGAAREWKLKAEATANALADAQDQLERRSRKFEAAQAEFDRRLQKHEERSLDLDAMQTRLDIAERELGVAREQLMALEVKLDILEGAANVLDGRTRAVLARRLSLERSAPV